MKETFILTKILLKNSLNTNNNGKSKVKAITMNILIFLAIAYIACVVGYLSYELISSLKTVNQVSAFLSLSLMLTVATCLIRTIISSLQLLYFSKDLEYLLPLPMTPIQIVFSKFNVIIISSYVIELFTLAVPFIVYGVLMMQEPIFYIMSLLVFLFLPVIPTLISVLISVVLMRFTNIFKNKDAVQYITVILAFVFVIGMQAFLMSNQEMTEFMFANKLLEVDGIARLIADYIIIVKQALIAVTEFGSSNFIINMIYLVGEAITAYVLVGLLTAKTYIKSATNITSGKKVKNTEVNISSRSICKAYVDKELKMLVRTPAFFLNTVLPVFIFPIIMILPFVNIEGVENSEDIYAFLQIISENMQNPLGLAIVLCMIIFLFAFNLISATSVSREGESAVVMKYLPIELHKQCRYKAIPGFLLNTFLILFITIGIKILFDVNTIFILEMLVITLLLNMFVSYFSVLIDVLNPKLHWTTEYSVVKQNMNMLWYMLFVLVIGIIVFMICSCFENIHVLTFVLSGLIIITTVFYDNFLKKNNINIFKKIS